MGWRRRVFSEFGPIALQSQGLVGKSEGDKVVLLCWGKRWAWAKDSRACPQEPLVEASQDRLVTCTAI